MLIMNCCWRWRVLVVAGWDGRVPRGGARGQPSINYGTVDAAGPELRCPVGPEKLIWTWRLPPPPGVIYGDLWGTQSTSGALIDP